MNDWELLRDYVENGSEASFTTLVKRYNGLVHSSALRQLRNASLADDVTQAVFIILARKSGRISPTVILSGWLFKTTRRVVSDVLKGERRRLKREFEAQLMKSNLESQLLEAEVDAALAALSETNRNILLLRFVEEKSLGATADRLKCNEETARKRVYRALEKLRKILQRRGVLTSSSILTAWLAEQTVDATVSIMPHAAPGIALAANASLRIANRTLGQLAAHQLKALAGLAAAIFAGSATIFYVHLAPPVPKAGNETAHLRTFDTNQISAERHFSWSEVESSDYREFMQKLRAIGCPEATIRDLVIADISRNYGAKMLAVFRRIHSIAHVGAVGDADMLEIRAELRRLKKEKRTAVENILGKDAVKDLTFLSEDFVAETTYAWLPQEKQERVSQIDDRSSELLNSISRSNTLFRIAGDETSARKKVLSVRQEELGQFLTPAELKEYEIRNSGIGLQIRINQFFQPAEHEVAAIYDSETALEQIPEPVGERVEDRSVRLAKKEEIAQQLRTAIGDERYQEYEQSKNPEWQDAFGFSQRFNLPEGTRDQIYLLLNQLDSAKQDSSEESIPLALREETRKKLIDLLGLDLFGSLIHGGKSRTKQMLN
jgi:RNA polymerase sigma factor (sigma-70 family)